MTHFLSDHAVIACVVGALVLGHAIALAWWIKQASKPMARGSGNPYLLKKKA